MVPELRLAQRPHGEEGIARDWGFQDGCRVPAGILDDEDGCPATPAFLESDARPIGHGNPTSFARGGRLPKAQSQNLSPCEHRSVAKDGRIICRKIVEGDNEVSPNECRACPFRQVNCAHLRFSLRQTSPSPLIVRFNGRTEVWDDEPPELCFERAACAAKVVPIHDPRACAGCALRQPLQAPAERPARRRRVAAAGKVVLFPGREPVAAAG